MRIWKWGSTLDQVLSECSSRSMMEHFHTVYPLGEQEWHCSLIRNSIGEGNGNPLQCSCLENPRDGVSQSRTPLKWLSSSSSIAEKWGCLLFCELCNNCAIFSFTVVSECSCLIFSMRLCMSYLHRINVLFVAVV